MAVYRRKVQRIGKSTFIVSLPNSWAKEVGLEPKTNIVMEVLPDLSLRIFAPHRQSASVSTEYVIDLRGSYDVDDVVREIIGGYVAGALSIKLAFEGLGRDVVNSAVSIAKDKLMGLEVVDEDARSVTLQVVVDPNLGDLIGITKRMTRLALSMHEDLATYLEGSADHTLLDAVIARDNIVDKLYLLALRQLTLMLRDPYEMGKKGMSYYDSIYMTMFLKSVERVADHAVNIATSIKALGYPPKYFLPIYRAAINIFRTACEAFLSVDKDMAVEAIRNIKAIKGFDEEVVRAHKDEFSQKPYAIRILDAICRIIARSLDIVEEVIDVYALRNIVRYGNRAGKAFVES